MLPHHVGYLLGLEADFPTSLNEECLEKGEEITDLPVAESSQAFQVRTGSD